MSKGKFERTKPAINIGNVRRHSSLGAAVASALFIERRLAEEAQKDEEPACRLGCETECDMAARGEPEGCWLL